MRLLLLETGGVFTQYIGVCKVQPRGDNDDGYV